MNHPAGEAVVDEKGNGDRQRGRLAPAVLAAAEELKVQNGARLRELRKKANFSIEALAKKTGIHYNSIARAERGEAEPTIAQLLALAEALGVPPELLSYFPVAPAPTVDAAEFVLVDMLDVRVSAGSGAINATEEVIGRFAFRRTWLANRGVSPQSARIIRARGDSMADQIKDGDILLVDTAVRHLEQDGVYVIELEGLDYVKLLQRDFATGGLQILSYNPAYPPQKLSASQAAELRISGRVVWHGGEL